MLPSSKRLDRGDAAVRERHDRLVRDRQQLPLDGVAEIGLELHAPGDLGLHGWFEQRVRAPAAHLRPVHRHVGVTQEVIRGAVAGRGDDDADAAADRHLPAFQVEWRFECGQDAVHKAERLVRQADVLDEDREFVAAKASDRVLGPENGTEAVGDRLEKGIAGRVAEAVVDGLEPIHVEIQEADQADGSGLASSARARGDP